jgi:ketol-acid reductoisomerase
LPARIYTDKDANLRWLKGKTSAVIGFGAQGRAHALNLRDSAMNVIVGLYPGSNSRARARRSGLRVFDTPEAVRRGDIIFLALSDTQMPAIYRKQIASNLRPGQTLLFAHGFAIYYRTIVPRKNVDVVMVAPKGLGPMVRREFVRGRGVPALVAVDQDGSRHTKQKESAARVPASWRRLSVRKLRPISLASKRYSVAAQARSFARALTPLSAPVIRLNLRTSNACTS